MTDDPGEPPPSADRRRLLLAFGATAVNVGLLHGLDLPSGARPPGPATPDRVRPGVDAPASAPTVPATPRRTQPPTANTPATPDAPPAPGPDHVFDLVVTGGRVMDPDSGFDGLADVGVDGDRITAVSALPLRGRDAIDATGRVVAPGFVDLLSYEPNPFGVWLKLADGVTTNLAMHGVNNYATPFFDRYRDQTPIHFGGAFHQHFMRGFDVGARIDLPLTPGQVDRLVGLAADGLTGGFAGIALSPEYSPGTSTEELVGLAEAAAARNHVCFVHVRHSDPTPPGTSLEAIDEVVALADATGVAVHISHLASTGGTNVMAEALDRLEAARSRGLDVTACVYPYDFWGTFLASARFAPGWQERYGLTEGDLQIAGTATRLSAETIGSATVDNKLVAAMGSIPETDVELALARDWVMVASDAIPTLAGNNHPRGAGTFARTIARYVRDRRQLDLMTALAKITILPTRRVEGMLPAMATKGRVQRGADADLVVFDPVAIVDRATVAAPARPSLGIDDVVVAGRVARRGGQEDRTTLAGVALQSAVR